MIDNHILPSRMTVSESTTADCVAECPHFDSVKGTCGHDLEQEIVRYFVDNPGAQCPIYRRWRARRMAELARNLDRR